MKQMHLWIKESDYKFLQRLAEDHDLSLSATIRRLIREKRRQVSTTAHTAETEGRPWSIPES